LFGVNIYNLVQSCQLFPYYVYLLSCVLSNISIIAAVVFSREYHRRPFLYWHTKWTYDSGNSLLSV